MSDRRATRYTLAAIQLLVAANGLWGGTMMITDSWELPAEWLQHTPFTSWTLPGLALLGFVGVGVLVAAILVLARHRLARPVAVASGAGLCAWIAVQLAWLRVVHPVMQPAIFAAGAAIIVLAWRLPPTVTD